METAQERARTPRNQLVLTGAIFAVLAALLAVGYFLFLRTDYVVLFEKLRPADAGAIVADLDKRGVAYRLRDGGATILVAADEADATRVAVAGSEIGAHGQTGFELFNKSDMGLTNFAQKINYQRALQGELVRTIMAMEGVEEARVHLALPERTLFRGDRADPTAAVTVTMKPGLTADPSRVAGIQRLVAAAVPDLPETKVVVLDASGRVISPAPVAQMESGRPADVEERAAVEGYYRARAKGAVERQMPGINFAIRVLVVPHAGEAGAVPQAASAAAASGGSWPLSGEGAVRNFRMRMIFVTEAALGAEDQTVVRGAIANATGISESLGDVLVFEVGPIDPAPLAASPAPAPSEPLRSETSPRLPDPSEAVVSTLWIWAVAGVALLLLTMVWFFRRSGKVRLNASDHEAFAARLRRQLNLEEGSDAAA